MQGWLRDQVLPDDRESGNGSYQTSVRTYGMEDNGAGARHFRDAGLSEGDSVLRCADGMEAAKR